MIQGTVYETHQSFLQNDIHGESLQNVEIHFILILDDTNVARVDMPFVVVGLDSARNTDVDGLEGHGLIAVRYARELATCHKQTYALGDRNAPPSLLY